MPLYTNPTPPVQIQVAPKLETFPGYQGYLNEPGTIQNPIVVKDRWGQPLLEIIDRPTNIFNQRGTPED